MWPYLFVKQVIVVSCLLLVGLVGCVPEQEAAVSTTPPPAETATNQPTSQPISTPTYPVTQLPSYPIAQPTTQPPNGPSSPSPLPETEEVTFSLTQLGGAARAVAVAGPIVYAGIGSRLVTVDISDPAAPRFLGQSEVLPALVDAVAIGTQVAADVAYVAAGADLYLYDVSDPTMPIRISTLARLVDPAEFFRVDLIPAGNVVYAVNEVYRELRSWLSLVALDVSNPAQPVVIGTRELPPSAAVTASGHVLYLASEGKLQLLDAGAPDKILGEIEIETRLSDVPWRYYVTVVGNLAYVGATDQPLLALDISNPAQPQLVGAGQLDHPINVLESAATGDSLFLVDQSAAPSTLTCSLLYVIDIAGTPRLAAEFNPQSCINDVAVAGDTLIAAAGHRGLQIFDAGDPANPRLVAEFVHPAGFTSADKIALNQDVAYIISGGPTRGESATLRGLDLTQPAAPELVGDPLDLDLPLGYPIHALYARENRVYVFRIGAMRLLDTSEPASLRLIRNELIPGIGDWIAPVPALVGNVLYATVPSASDVLFGVVDMSDPANPRLVNTIPSRSEGICGMSVSGSHLLSALCDGTGVLYDLSDPFKPVEAGDFELSSAPDMARFAVAGDTLYMTDSNGIRVLDISDPAHPAEIGRLALPIGFGEIVAAGDIVYILGGDGIWAINIGDRSRPYVSGHLQLPRYNHQDGCCNLSVDGDWLYVAAGDAGLFVLQVEK